MTFYTIQPDDVGCTTIRAFGRLWPVEDFIGQILPVDVGKRVFRIENGAKGFLQVENDTQRDERVRKEQK